MANFPSSDRGEALLQWENKRKAIVARFEHEENAAAEALAAASNIIKENIRRELEQVKSQESVLPGFILRMIVQDKERLLQLELDQRYSKYELEQAQRNKDRTAAMVEHYNRGPFIIPAPIPNREGGVTQVSLPESRSSIQTNGSPGQTTGTLQEAPREAISDHGPDILPSTEADSPTPPTTAHDVGGSVGSRISPIASSTTAAETLEVYKNSKRKSDSESVHDHHKRQKIDAATSSHVTDARTIPFQEVFLDGKAEYKHFIVRANNDWYILKCEKHGVHFRKNALMGAAKHLNGSSHGNMPKEHHLALELLGYRVTGCNEKLAALNNSVADAAFKTGYTPLNKLARPGPQMILKNTFRKRPTPQKSQTNGYQSVDDVTSHMPASRANSKSNPGSAGNGGFLSSPSEGDPSQQQPTGGDRVTRVTASRPSSDSSSPSSEPGSKDEPHINDKPLISGQRRQTRNSINATLDDEVIDMQMTADDHSSDEDYVDEDVEMRDRSESPKFGDATVTQDVHDPPRGARMTATSTSQNTQDLPSPGRRSRRQPTAGWRGNSIGAPDKQREPEPRTPSPPLGPTRSRGRQRAARATRTQSGGDIDGQQQGSCRAAAGRRATGQSREGSASKQLSPIMTGASELQNSANGSSRKASPDEDGPAVALGTPIGKENPFHGNEENRPPGIGDDNDGAQPGEPMEHGHLPTSRPSTDDQPNLPEHGQRATSKEGRGLPCRAISFGATETADTVRASIEGPVANTIIQQDTVAGTPKFLFDENLSPRKALERLKTMGQVLEQIRGRSMLQENPTKSPSWTTMARESGASAPPDAVSAARTSQSPSQDQPLDQRAETTIGALGSSTLDFSSLNALPSLESTSGSQEASNIDAGGINGSKEVTQSSSSTQSINGHSPHPQLDVREAQAILSPQSQISTTSPPVPLDGSRERTSRRNATADAAEEGKKDRGQGRENFSSNFAPAPEKPVEKPVESAEGVQPADDVEHLANGGNQETQGGHEHSSKVSESVKLQGIASDLDKSVDMSMSDTSPGTAPSPGPYSVQRTSGDPPQLLHGEQSAANHQSRTPTVGQSEDSRVQTNNSSAAQLDKVPSDRFPGRSTGETDSTSPAAGTSAILARGVLVQGATTRTSHSPHSTLGASHTGTESARDTDSPMPTPTGTASPGFKVEAGNSAYFDVGALSDGERAWKWKTGGPLLRLNVDHGRGVAETSPGAGFEVAVVPSQVTSIRLLGEIVRLALTAPEGENRSMDVTFVGNSLTGKFVSGRVQARKFYNWVFAQNDAIQHAAS